MSRAQLSRDTGLSKPTVSQALANLERAGLVRSVGAASGGRGRMAVLYEPDATAGYVVGVDVGGSWVRCGVADLAGSLVGRRDVRNRARSAKALVDTVTALAHDAVRDAGLTWSSVVHTQVGSPGVFDQASGRLLFAPNLPGGWERSGLVERLEQALGTPVTVENDANLAAVGERTFGLSLLDHLDPGHRAR